MLSDVCEKKTLEINADINNVIIVYIKWSFCVVKTIKFKKYVDIFSLYSDQWAQPANMISLRCSHTPTVHTLYERLDQNRQTLTCTKTDKHTEETNRHTAIHPHTLYMRGWTDTHLHKYRQTHICINTEQTHRTGQTQVEMQTQTGKSKRHPHGCFQVFDQFSIIKVTTMKVVTFSIQTNSVQFNWCSQQEYSIIRQQFISDNDDLCQYFKAIHLHSSRLRTKTKSNLENNQKFIIFTSSSCVNFGHTFQ